MRAMVATAFTGSWPMAPCAQVCPVDAILVSEDARCTRRIRRAESGARTDVHGSPWGVPKFDVEGQLVYKWNLCYDRTSVGLGPMCATVCPSDALYYGTAGRSSTSSASGPLGAGARLSLAHPQGEQRVVPGGHRPRAPAGGRVTAPPRPRAAQSAWLIGSPSFQSDLASTKATMAPVTMNVRGRG